MKNDEQPMVYNIPPNYSPEGTILSGTFKLRNAIEAVAIVLAVVGPLVYFHPFSVKTIVVLAVVISLPLGIIALVGVNDGSLFEFLGDVLHYLMSKKNIIFHSEYQQEMATTTKKEKKEVN